MATLPGLALCERFGFEVVSHGPITLPDGILPECRRYGEADRMSSLALGVVDRTAPHCLMEVGRGQRQLAVRAAALRGASPRGRS
jgi:hypothetical protein